MFHQECAQIREDVLRLHVLANSDSEEDQALKLAVRDKILADTGEIFNQADNQTDARAAAIANLSVVEEAAHEALREAGADTAVHAEVVRMVFRHPGLRWVYHAGRLV